MQTAVTNSLQQQEAQIAAWQNNETGNKRQHNTMQPPTAKHVQHICLIRRQCIRREFIQSGISSQTDHQFQ